MSVFKSKDCLKPSAGKIFINENKGAMMGCSNPHPHGQVSHSIIDLRDDVKIIPDLDAGLYSFSSLTDLLIIQKLRS
jgi:hypothetical protein